MIVTKIKKAIHLVAKLSVNSKTRYREDAKSIFPLYYTTKKCKSRNLWRTVAETQLKCDKNIKIM